MSNRLAAATSPYLLQHKDNPVDWWQWGDDAFAEARRLDKPILLSVGYSSCHWCHVMAHESFESPEIARLVNDGWVAIKVDREERPDVDAVYMDAVTATTGQGGWPMTCFLTPDGHPFFAGTYFPPAQLGQLLVRGAEVWRTQREAVEKQGAELVTALAGTSAYDPAQNVEIDLSAAVSLLLRQLDPENGGFGRAPKFPPSMCLEWLLRHHARTGSPEALKAVELTCERMARGGVYDQLAGGFARYSVDPYWVVPHFEKMLYDNALLARVYLHLWRQTGSGLGRRIAEETCAFLVRDLQTADGGFASALDADTEGEEGKTYVWTPDEVGPYAAEVFHVTTGGTFEHGTSVLQLPRDPADPSRFAEERERLLLKRLQRPQPACDDKVVAAWNGLAISALAECGVLLDRPDWVAAAVRAAELLERVHVVGGRLRRTSRDGVVGANAGVLDDHALVADGYLTLHQVTGERRWLDAAGRLVGDVLAHFADPATGSFFDTADDAEVLMRRPQDPSDNATPSGAAAAAGALVTYGAVTGSTEHREAAAAALQALSPLASRQPRFAGHALAVAEALAAGPLEVAVVGRPDLLAVARRATSPGAVVVGGGDSPLFADRPAGAAYVCRGFVCEAPTTDPETLAHQVDARVTA
ncbi:MAG TPA: thioredoxin domain-containing protein [Mycobacteriales bacterium]